MASIKVVAFGLAIAIVIANLVQRLSRAKRDPREPPVLQPTIPFIGHLIGTLRHGAKYISITSKQCNYPIYSLPMLSGQTYIVTSPNLASHIQRASSTLVFTDLIVPVTARLVGFEDKETVAIVADRNAKAENRPSFMDRMHEHLYSTMSPSEIKGTGQTMQDQLAQRVNALQAVCEKNMFEWVRELFLDVTVYSFYGPRNPFAMDPSLIKDYWDWEYELVGTMASPFPQLTNRKSYLGRERMVAGLLEYLKQENYKSASEVVKGRVRMHTEGGISLRDKARSELGMLFGAVVNGAVSAFWMTQNIFSRPQLLEELREEIRKAAFSIDGSSQTATISFEGLKSCALLNSVFKETIRLVAPMTSPRWVTEDTIVADQYLLRANSVVQVAGIHIHEDTSVWGPDALSFNPRRFISSPFGTKTGTSGEEKSTVHPAAWRGFGGGSVYCPGRHFAQMEILSLVAMLVLGWDLEPPKGQDSIKFDPPKDETRMPLGIMKPLEDVKVTMKRRDGTGKTKWVLKID